MKWTVAILLIISAPAGLACGEEGRRGPEGPAGEAGDLGLEGGAGPEGPQGVAGAPGPDFFRGCVWSTSLSEGMSSTVALCDAGFYATIGGCRSEDLSTATLRENTSVTSGSDGFDVPETGANGVNPIGWSCVYDAEGDHVATVLCCSENG